MHGEVILSISKLSRHFLVQFLVVLTVVVSFTQGVACAEVEVDFLTGDHRTVRADIIVDVGSSINPAIDIGQIEGAFVQGMGWSTIEEVIHADSDHVWIKPRGSGAYYQCW